MGVLNDRQKNHTKGLCRSNEIFTQRQRNRNNLKQNISRKSEKMPVDEIIKEIEKQDKIIDEAQKVKKLLFQKLKNADKEAFDWITVQAAANLLGVSICTIYNKINAGKLRTKHINSSIRVSKSEILEIDDK